MNFLIFDTETTGFTKYCDDNGKDLKNHNRITQLAFILCNNKGDELHKFESLVKPNGWFIPNEDFFKENNMSTDRCEKYGIPIFDALRELQEALKRCDYKVAHNISFDNRMITAEMIKSKITKELFQFKKGLCTMRSSRDFVLAKDKMNRTKAPNLQELYKYLFNDTFDGAHDALEDVRATKKCFLECLDRNIITL